MRNPSVDREDRGAALLLAAMVCAILATVGLVFLSLADTETRITTLRRDQEQVMRTADAGALSVKAWFDRPVSGEPGAGAQHLFLSRFDLRDPAHFDRAARLIDADADDLTPPVPADGSPGREFYRQGRNVSAGYPHLDFFGKPFRGSTALAFLGTAQGPDLVLSDLPGVVDLLDEINAELFPRQEITGRIERIDVFGPPSIAASSPGARLGVATVQVTAAKYRRLDRSGGVQVVPPGARPTARAVVRMGLAEIPVGSPRGALEACGDLTVGGRLRARWGRVTAMGRVTLAGPAAALDVNVASGFPYSSLGRHITGLAPGDDLAAWLGNADRVVEDPWLVVAAGGLLTGWETLADQPFPYSASIEPGRDHSNLFQRIGGLRCPSFDYDLWKSLSLGVGPGDRHSRYFAFDPNSGLFRENGRGPLRSVREWTHGEQGLFFFDTTDGSRPRAGNLTPPVRIAGGDWSTAGLIYLNARSFEADSIRGTSRILLPPGEPFDDRDRDGVQTSSEFHLNLRYPVSVGTGAAGDEFAREITAAQTAVAASPDGETYRVDTTMDRDLRGIPIVAEINLMGLLVNSGEIVAQGAWTVYGSLVAGGDVTQSAPGADSPTIYFDDRFNTGEWPPPEIAMPRTYITFWQTSHP
ncbi:MAG TPA: hypothetical protein VFG76_13090 [Candidatus Polarisedimenticolia bacterium]|nr:hypothetical protein [Candidatus Polarisedimenticolia bacterium]